MTASTTSKSGGKSQEMPHGAAEQPVERPFPPVITEEIAAAIREEYPKIKIYKKHLAGQDYAFRYLTRREYLEIQRMFDESSNMSPAELDEKLFDRCVIFPSMPPNSPERATLPAGVVPTIARLIEEKSGFEGTNIRGRIPDFSVQHETLFDDEGWAAPDPEMLETIKENAPKRYANSEPWPLAMVTYDHKYAFIIRALGRIEFNNIMMQVGPNIDRDLELAKRGLVWPETVDWDSLPAGIPLLLSQAIINRSGFSATSDVEEL